MTKKEAIIELNELEMTFPIPPYEGDEAIRAKETSERLTELFNYIYAGAAKPKDGWKTSVPSPTGEERERIARHWMNATIAGLQNMDDWL